MSFGGGWVDTRIAGIETDYVSPPKDSRMRIPDQLIKCVAFIARHEDEGTFGGTGFIVGVKQETRMVLCHLVTAKHVAEAIEPGEAIFGFNGKDGSPFFLRTGEQKWFYHPTDPDHVDVAVIPVGSARFDQYDISFLPEENFVDDAVISKYGIGLGDELYTIGLFTKFFGTTHLIPIVRTGNIAMMPRDKVPVEQFGEMEAYLAEGRSIGGLSGSPVFCRSTVNMPMQTPDGKRAHLSGLGPLHFLGLMHGHWDLPLKFSDAEKAEAVNMGVSIIVPAKKIREVLYHPELVAMRKEYADQLKKSNQPTADAAFGKSLTKKEFEDALKKVSRKTKS
jgi:hypothetical protein